MISQPTCLLPSNVQLCTPCLYARYWFLHQKSCLICFIYLHLTCTFSAEAAGGKWSAHYMWEIEIPTHPEIWQWGTGGSINCCGSRRQDEPNHQISRPMETWHGPMGRIRVAPGVDLQPDPAHDTVFLIRPVHRVSLRPSPAHGSGLPTLVPAYARDPHPPHHIGLWSHICCTGLCLDNGPRPSILDQARSGMPDRARACSWSTGSIWLMEVATDLGAGSPP